MFDENYSGDGGGGIYNYSDSSPIITNTTFLNNDTGKDGDAIHNDDSTPEIVSCEFEDEFEEDDDEIYHTNQKTRTKGEIMYQRAMIKTVLACLLANLCLGGTINAQDLYLQDSLKSGMSGSVGKIFLENQSNPAFSSSLVEKDDNVTLNACGSLLFSPSFKVMTGAVFKVVVTDTDANTDEDQLMDCAEMAYFGELQQDQSGNYDNDGLTNGTEILANLNPASYDTDSDGLPDGWESDPTNAEPNSGKVKGSFYQYDALGRLINKMRTTEQN